MKDRQVARVVLYNHESKEALLIESLSGSIKFPGGGCEDGESPETAAIREISEETGLSLIVQNLHKLPTLTVTMQHEGKKMRHGLQLGYIQTVNWFYCLQWTGIIMSTDPEEVRKLFWVSSSEVSKLLTHPEQKQAWQNFQHEITRYNTDSA